MICSGASEYAIRALAYLAREKRGEFVLLRNIARAEKIPEPYLGKILQNLVHKGLLRSGRGSHGGFALDLSPKEISIYKILKLIDGTEKIDGCSIGFKSCSDKSPCCVHYKWKPVKVEIDRFLKSTTLADISLPAKKGSINVGLRMEKIRSKVGK